jgi:putative photosynthetic complex assembly protein
MSDPFSDQPLPRGILLAGAALAAVTLLAVATVQVTGKGRYVSAVAPVAETRELQFRDRAEGGVAVIDARTQQPVRMLLPGEDGFIRASVRTMAQERMRRGMSADTPFLLKRHVDGNLSFEDPLTRRVLSLEAFGATNRAAFARLLDEPSR